MKINELIKVKRKEKGITQKELAELLGKDRTTVNKYECGVIDNFNKKTIVRLSNILGIPVQDFFKAA